jgi:hypothetical protein
MNMKSKATNEADVRAEIADPLLAALGYARGTDADIARELTLSYERNFLGRKKATDPLLRGRADYVLTVVGAARWVLETKSPDDPIDRNAIEQAITYARHPEVAASYSVILNGDRLVVYHVSQASTSQPLIELNDSDPIELARKLQGVLSPAAIRRDCSPPIVDLQLPLAEGLRSSADIRTGEIRYDTYRWSCNAPLPLQQRTQLDETCRRLIGWRAAITGGSVHRNEASRILARLNWASSNDELHQFAIDKKLMDMEYVALSQQISSDPENPTVFDNIGEVQVDKGERLFSILKWESTTAGIAMNMQIVGRATGYIQDFVFQGAFAVCQYCRTPLNPAFQLVTESEGTFRVEFDRR